MSSPCLDDAQIVRYFEGALDVEAREQIEVHVDQCTTCRELVAGIAKARVASARLSDPGSGARRAQFFLGRYEVGAMLGQGGMGVVHRAFDRELEEWVVLKRPKKGSASEEHIERVRHEVSLARRVSHPNVCRVHELLFDEEEPVVVMEYIDGTNIAEWAASKKPDESRIASLLGQVIEGLIAIHDAGIIHRDLKPTNVLVDRAERAIVCDFGLAIEANLSQGRARWIGTPTHWSPEQAQGKPASVASDVFAFGRTALDVFDASGTSPSRDFVELLTQAMQPFPEDRFSSFRELRNAWHAAARSAGSEPMVGRPHELAEVRGLVSRSRTLDTPTIFLIRGDTGVGKSRFLREIDDFASRLKLPTRFLRGRRDRGGSTWYALENWMFEETIQCRFEDVAGLELGKFTRWLETHGSISPAEASSLVRKLAVRAERDPEAISPAASRAAHYYIAQTILNARGQALFLVDDWHLLDEESAELFTALLSEGALVPSLMIATVDDVRSPRASALVASAEERNMSSTVLPLRPLSLEDSVRVAKAAGAARAEEIAKLAGGNPALLTMLLSEPEVDPARSAEFVLEAILDRWPGPLREAAALFAAWKRPFSKEEVARAIGEDPGTPLSDLVRRGVLWCVADRYEFRSPLVAAEAYRRLDSKRKCAIHLAIANDLVQSGGESVEIARHYAAANERNLAASRLVDAIARARAVGGLREVLELSDELLGLFANASDVSKLECWRKAVLANIDVLALQLGRAEAFRYRGHWEAQKAELETALSFTKTETERAWVLRQLAFAESRAGRTDEATHFAEQAIRAAIAGGDSETLALCSLTSAQTNLFAGRRDEAQSDVERALRLGEQCSLYAQAQISEWSGLVAHARGEIGAAYEHWTRANALYLQGSRVHEATVLQQNLADILIRVGANTEAMTALGRVLEEACKTGNRLAQGYALANFAHASAREGRPRFDLLAEADEIALAMRDHRLRNAVRIFRAEAFAVEGPDTNLTEAEKIAREALDGESSGSSENIMPLRILLARIHLKAGNLVAASENVALAKQDANAESSLDQIFDLRSVEVELARAINRPDEEQRATTALGAQAANMKNLAAIAELGAAIDRMIEKRFHMLGVTIPT